MESWLKRYTYSNDKKHVFYLSEAYKEAESSPDPCTQIGALLVDESGVIVARSHNGPTRGVKLNEVIDERKKYFEHAERNVIFQAAKKGIATEGLVMYCPWHPCKDCARALVASGITRLISHKCLFLLTPTECMEKFNESYWILKKGKVDYLLYADKIEGINIKFKTNSFSSSLGSF